MLRRYVGQILSLYNYIDGIIVTDRDGYVEYYATYRPDVNNLKEREILRKHITEVYPMLDEETSSIMRVLRKDRTSAPLIPLCPLRMETPSSEQ